MCENAWSAFRIIEVFVDKFPDFLMKMLWYSGILTKAGHVPLFFYKLKFSYNFHKVLIYFSSFLPAAFFLSAIFYHSLYFRRPAELGWMYVCFQKTSLCEIRKGIMVGIKHASLRKKQSFSPFLFLGVKPKGHLNI